MQLAGYTAILPDSTVTAMVPTQDPFTPSDPGSPAHLGNCGARPSRLRLIIVDTDGLHVYGLAAGE